MRIRAATALIALLSLAACAKGQAPAALAPVAVGDLGWSCTSSAHQEALARELAAIDVSSLAADGVTAAVSVHDDTGMNCSYQGDEEFYAASTIKVVTATAVLSNAQEISEETWDRIESAIISSDNQAQQKLWEQAGGGQAMTDYMVSIGMDNSAAIPGDDGSGLAMVSADDMALFWNSLSQGRLLDQERTRRVLGFASTVADDQDWGIGAGTGKNDRVQLKNGWLDEATADARIDPGTSPWMVNSTGHISSGDDGWAIAVMTTGNKTHSAGITTVEEISTAVNQVLLDR